MMVSLRNYCSDRLSTIVFLPLIITWSRPWIPFSRPFVRQWYLFKTSSSFCAKFESSILVFLSVMRLPESPRNSWISDCIKMFLFLTVEIPKFLFSRIGIILGVCSAHNSARLLKRASACSSQLSGSSWPASSSLRTKSYRLAAKLSSNFVIETTFVKREMTGKASKYHKLCAPDVLADPLIKS